MRTILLSAIFLAGITKLFADDLSEGYQSFINNDIKGAYVHFKAATAVPETRAESYLMLSFLSSIHQENDTAFSYFLDFYRNSSNPDPYLLSLINTRCVFGFESLKTKTQLNWIQELIKRNNLNSTLKARLYVELGKYYETMHDLKSSREYFTKIGAVMNWQIAGDFDNISASGFDKDYAPVSHPEPEAVFKNKLNADVKWFDLYKQTPGKWIDFTNNFLCTNTLVFAQTFCNSPQDQIVYLRVGTSGSLKIWVNDQLLFKEEEERNNDIDTYIVPVKVFKGTNRILLQIACSKIERCNFMMRVTDKDGNLNDNLTYSSDYKPYSKNSQELPSLIDAFDEEYLSSQIREHPDKLVNYLVLTEAYLSNDKIHPAMDVIVKAQKMAPKCSFILQQLSELYYRDKKKTSHSITQEQLKLIDPDNPKVLNYLIDNAFASDNTKDARQFIEKKEHLYGENKDVLYYKMKLASSENKHEEYAALINKGYTMYPNDYDFVYYKFKHEKENKQNQKGGVIALKDYTRKYFNPNALQTLADEVIESGQVNDGIDILKKLVDYLPFNDSYYKQLGLIYLKKGNYIAAKKYFEECLKIAPYFGSYHGFYAETLASMGSTEQANHEYQLNITYKPDDYEAIKKLRSLQSKKEVFDFFPTRDYYKLFDQSPSASDYPSDNFISISDDRQVVLYENGGCELRQILLYKALTIKGIDDLKEYKVGHYSNEDLTIEKAEVLKKNGNRLQAEVHDNHVVYTSLEPGDGVLLIYKTSKMITDQMSKQFFEKWYLNNWFPALNIEYNLLVSKNITFSYKVDHFDCNPEKKDTDDFTLYTWKTVTNKPIRLETYMPSMIDVYGLLSISTVKDWNYISNWYFDISNTKTKPDRDVTETVNNLLKGKENCSEMEKARIFYKFIEENIHYSSVPFRQNGVVPQKASDALITRIGDCKDLVVLFTSMCHVVGIKAGMVLVLTHKNGANWMSLPNFSFDHTISRVVLDGNEYYIELTSNYLPFAALPESDLEAVVLDVEKDSTVPVLAKKLNPDTRKPNNSYRESNVYFRGDSLVKSVYIQRTGSMTAWMRYFYRDLGREEQEKKFTQSISDSYSNTKLLTLHFNSTLKDCSDTLTYDYSAIAPKVFTTINGLYIVNLPLIDKLKPMDFLSIEERKFPVEVWKYALGDTSTEKLTIAFPENQKLAEVPKTVHFSCKQADYTLTFMVQGKELKVERRMINLKDEVPVSDYTAYRTFIESVVNADSQKIGFLTANNK